MTKEFIDLDDMIDLLKSRNLSFQDETTAKHLLLNYGYYEIVNGYKDFLITDPSSDSDWYVDGATFENLFSLYNFDKSLRKDVRDATSEFEHILRSLLSYVVSKNFGHLEKDYLDKQNYEHGYINDDGLSQLDYLIDKVFQRTLNSRMQPYAHYREDHGNIPPWILLKDSSLGNLVNFYKLLKSNEKQEVIRHLLKLDPGTNITKEHYNAINTIVELSLKFRNTASHSGRIYNYKAPFYNTPYHEIAHMRMQISKKEFYEYNKGRNDIYTLLYFLSLLSIKKPYILLYAGITYHLEIHLSSYPDDREKLLKEMGVPNKNLDCSLDEIFSFI